MFMRRIETTIDIAAPPDRVWATLVDFPAHAAWNPFIREISGEARAGSGLTMAISPDGAKTWRFAPKVLAAEPGRELRWLGIAGVAGLFDGEHVFRLEPHAGGTRLVHGETFSGLLVPLLGGMLAKTQSAFDAMNRALKARVEAAA